MGHPIPVHTKSDWSPWSCILPCATLARCITEYLSFSVLLEFILYLLIVDSSIVWGKRYLPPPPRGGDELPRRLLCLKPALLMGVYRNASLRLFPVDCLFHYHRVAPSYQEFTSLQQFFSCRKVSMPIITHLLTPSHYYSQSSIICYNQFHNSSPIKALRLRGRAISFPGVG